MIICITGTQQFPMLFPAFVKEPLKTNCIFIPYLDYIFALDLSVESRPSNYNLPRPMIVSQLPSLSKSSPQTSL